MNIFDPAINLDNLQGIPEEFLNELKQCNSLFMENRFLENLIQKSAINNLVHRINEYCMERRVIGFHYTRAIPNEILLSGLVCRTGNEIRNNFLSKHQQVFTEDEKILIRKVWDNNFGIQQQKSRDNRLFFNFTTCALSDNGAEPLLSNFGGEQVYMPLQYLDGIATKIKDIGKSLVLKCKLNPQNLNTFHENPWGRIAVSTYHCKLNPEALQIDQDGYQKVDVNPKDIEIIEYHYKIR